MHRLIPTHDVADQDISKEAESEDGGVEEAKDRLDRLVVDDVRDGTVGAVHLSDVTAASFSEATSNSKRHTWTQDKYYMR